MSAIEKPEPCGNETCPRPAEPGEAFCEECGLEHALFRREGRRERDRIRASETLPEAGR
jgi:hypothetical protein